MISLMKSLGCGMIIASLIMPSYVFANSLHVPAQNNAVQGDGDLQEEGEPLKLPTEDTQEEAQNTGNTQAEGTEEQTAAQEQGASAQNVPVVIIPEEQAPAAQSAQPAAGQEAPSASIEKEVITGLTLGDERSSLKGNALIIPAGAEDASFLNGSWSFDRYFVRPDGATLKAEFNFDENALGTVSLVSESGVRHTAPARAAMSDGALKIQTGTFSNKESLYVYNPEFMECRNSDGAALCNGSDGFSSWEGGRLMGSAAQAGAAQGQSEAHTSSSAAVHSAQSAQVAENNALPAPAAENFTEVSDEGAELAPSIMESAEKAKMKDGVSSLAGDWRYSRDLARKSDGKSVALEFHFDNNGKGYSLIKEGSGKEFKASASALGTDKGTLRVKTGAYLDGKGNGYYYPTFMECKSGENKELMCDVSNGWTRIEGGKLIALRSLEEQDRQMRVEELLPVAPQAQEDSGNIADVLAELSETAASQSQNTNSNENRKEGAALSLPKNDKKMDFLEGRWRCNTGLVSSRDNQPVVVEFRFDKNGRGTATTREKRSGDRYDASARATYKNGVLRVNTSEFRSKKSRGGYYSTSIECRDQGGQAICNGSNGGITWRGVRFIRLK